MSSLAKEPGAARPFILIALLLLAAASPSAAKELSTGTGAVIDMPSGFTPLEGSDETRYAYTDANRGMELDILIFAPGRYGTAEAMAADILGQMGSTGDTSSYPYQGRDAVIADLEFSAAGISRKGYAVFICDPGKPGSGYALVASTESTRFDSYSELILSCLDSFSIDPAARRFPGPISQFLIPLPAARGEKKTVSLPAGTVTLPWSSQEAKDEISLAQREYRVLTMYLQSETLWKDAWARYYRMVYKQSSAPLDDLVKAFASSLPADDPTECARKVLSWVQDFHYERDFAGIDFVPPLVAAFERRGDCDSRAMVMGIILESMGIDAVLLVSREYSHAMLAVDVPGGGQRFPFKGKSYLVAETTAKVGIGKIDSTQTDLSKWLPVDIGR
jgi:hypothetical protein